MENILVPIDFSPVGAHSLDTAARIAAPLGAKVWVVHVAAPDPDFIGLKVGPQYIREQRADILREEHRDIQRMAEELVGRGLKAEALLVQGPTTDTLFELVDKLKIDLIVMGSHGRGALFKAFVGSISQQVLTESKVPVLIVPSPDRD